MKRLNPLYILALVATLLIISFSMLFSIQDEYKELSSTKDGLQSKAKAFNEYKTKWFDKKRVEARVDMLIKNNMFKKEKVLKVVTKEAIKLKLESKNPKVLQTFLTRVLNEKFMVRKLQLEDSFISLEIGNR